MAKVNIQFSTSAEYGEYKNAKIAELHEKVAAYNAATAVSDRDKIEDEITEICRHIKEAARCETMMECMVFDNPTLEACKRRFYETVTTSVKDKAMSVIKKNVEIDLTTFNSAVYINWKYMVELLCKYCTGDLAADLGAKATVDAMARFKVSQEAMDCKESIASGKLSTSVIKKALDKIIPVMIGSEYHAQNADARFFVSAFTKKGKGLVLKCLNNRQTVGLLMDICYHLVTGIPYEVWQKQIKKAD